MGDSQGWHKIVMTRSGMEGIPHFEFPQGFSAEPMKPGDVPAWTEIWQELEPPGKIDDGLFHREFGSDWSLISQRCLLARDGDGSPVGTVSAWFDDSFKGGRWGRIHWVALRKRCQGKGLAKPMLSAAMRILAKRHERCYLVTQTHRIPAIKLYLDFGFSPDISSAEDFQAWEPLQGAIESPALKAALSEASLRFGRKEP